MIKGKIDYCWFDKLNRYSIGNADADRDKIGVTVIADFLSNAAADDSLFSINTHIKDYLEYIDGDYTIGMLFVSSNNIVYASGECILIENIYFDDGNVYMTGEQFLDHLLKYNQVFYGKKYDQNTPPPDIEVEYIAEGEEADRLWRKKDEELQNLAAATPEGIRNYKSHYNDYETNPNGIIMDDGSILPFEKYRYYLYTNGHDSRWNRIRYFFKQLFSW